MDEGKPAKAKWWSRPHPQTPSARTESPDDGDGDGDFELARPLPPAGPDSGDYELSGPVSTAIPASDGATPSDGQGSSVVGAGEARGASPEADGSGVAGPVGPPPPSVERPKPLHDPDAYSTPPYGEPGPWAPAPPVQHPAVASPGHLTPPPAATAHLGQAPAAPPHLGPVPAPAPGIAPDPAPGQPVDPAPGKPASDPWRRYDPWSPTPLAGAGALHQTGAAVPSEAQRRRKVRKGVVGGALALALVSGVLGGLVGAHLERNGGFEQVELPQAAAEPTGRAADSVAGIAARALPSVVTLHVSGSEESGTGTGFVLDTRGHILTNDHVVEPAGDGGEITVVFNGGQTAEAEVVGRDSGYDLAVVKVSGVSGLAPLTLGNSDGVQVGDPVVAIGAPFDLEGTVTSGIISAKERPITAGGESGDGSDVSYVDALQTDAPINPGNSGGPLLDAHGRVIGINSAIRSAADGSDPENGQVGSIGLGFAIPINQGKRVAEELINTGRATHPVIGITLDMDYTGDGARVGTKGGDGGAPVSPGGPGDLAGIEPGDVITEVDGQRIHSGDELIVKTRAHRPGDRLELTVERDGAERTLSLVLGSADGD
ncbi:trypsin-like peptidase domain-containing protein [Streptomyces antibioticus]|uniref:PDZ domain-containing protein n=1 Tax=Streptomyces antibioticus TaxID=1890 RepID=A0AAE6YCV0_STRAT|nr:trypsin-like peptidase domain-containing protein [Streptomyces antibioticus]OOQ49531.1 protease [Streptomyces antibioticus]QIT46484.1 PDZ domain-containing protein [Streptomyces antibioticus]